MTKAELVSALEKQGNIQHKQSEMVVNICFESMVRALYEDKRIEIRGFGTFTNRCYKSYKGRNPKTGKMVEVQSKKVPFFRAGKELRIMVDQGRTH